MSNRSTRRSLAIWYTPEAKSRRSTDPVYGAGVATHDFTNALIRFSRIPVLELLTPWDATMTAKPPLFAQDREAGPELRVRPVDALFSARPDFPIGVYHDIHADPVRGFRLRGLYSPQPFPVTLTHHTVSYATQREDWYRRLLLEDVRPYDSIICTSTAARDAIRLGLAAQADFFERRFAKRMDFRGRLDVLPLGVDAEIFRPRDRADARAQMQLPSKPFIFLWVGRFSAAQKGDLLPLIRVFRMLQRANSKRDLMLVLAGTSAGPDAQFFTDYAEKLGVASKVRVMTDLEPSRRHLLYGVADVFVSPVENVQETFGITPIEALAAGVPQVVSDWDGYRDTVVDGETGFRIPTLWMKAEADVMPATLIHQDPHLDHGVAGQGTAVDFGLLQQRLQELLDNPQLLRKMGRASRKRALACFDWRPLIRRYEELWKTLGADARRDTTHAARSRERAPDLHSLFGLFHGYATVLLDDKSRIRLRADAKDIVEGKEPVPSYHRGFGLDGELIAGLMQELLWGGKKGRTFTQLLEAFPERHPDLVRRHGMWLLKYGYAERVG